LTRTVPIIQFGLGGVGQALLRQIIETRQVVAQRAGLHLSIVALLDSSGGLWEPGGVDEETLRRALAAKREGVSLRELRAGRARVDGAALVTRVAVAGVTNAVVVDATAAHDLAEVLLKALGQGYGLVLANKRPLTTSMEVFQRFMGSGRLRYEATVGAGLPVISTLRYLLDCGDEVTAIEGSLSGTVGFLCTMLQGGVPFSQALAEARRLGYTEPDPREDLGGVDTARKTLILARTLGWKVELADVMVESLYPADMDGLSVEEFMEEASSLDAGYTFRAREAADKGEVLRYVATVRDGRCRMELKEVSARGYLGALQGADSLVVFHSARYADSPMVIGGLGAGPEVTAAAMLADIISLARESRG
jgi:homoserine dehydrogenase